MESKAGKKGGDNNLTLIVKSRREKVKDLARVRERVRIQPHRQRRRT
jgi:hypothetical protein